MRWGEKPQWEQMADEKAYGKGAENWNKNLICHLCVNKGTLLVSLYDLFLSILLYLHTNGVSLQFYMYWKLKKMQLWLDNFEFNMTYSAFAIYIRMNIHNEHTHTYSQTEFRFIEQKSKFEMNMLLVDVLHTRWYS